MFNYFEKEFLEKKRRYFDAHLAKIHWGRMVGIVRCELLTMKNQIGMFIFY